MNERGKETMGKKKLLFGIAVILAAAGIALAARYAAGTRPFRDLTEEEIQTVTVELYPPDVKAELDAAQIEELISVLQEVVIYNRDDSYNLYAGQAVVYTVTKTDGTVIEISAYNPFLIIDRVGYRTEYEPCQELNGLGNRIADTPFG